MLRATDYIFYLLLFAAVRFPAAGIINPEPEIKLQSSTMRCGFVAFGYGWYAELETNIRIQKNCKLRIAVIRSVRN